jgi:phytanoyl-CoA hydroxylase
MFFKRIENKQRSRFGTLWTDRTNAEALAREKLRKRKISEQDFQDLLFWFENGYLVKSNACDPDLLDQIQAAIHEAARSGSRQVTFWDAAGKHQVEARPEHLMKAEAKLLDVHSTIPAVQDVIFSEPIVRFLNLVFGEAALAFQTLYFERGSEQGAHQDTAFVYVDHPLDLAATWIALEDIAPGTGELFYFPGSHRLPDRIFASGTKSLLPGDPAAADYTANLIARCRELGLEEQRFLPKRGDVLFWTADLVHGGSPRTTNNTRRSLVTHYCPSSRRPPYGGQIQPRPAPRGQFLLSQT